MIDISFIADETLKTILERDIAELEGCINNNLYKSTVIMAGSIIEAVLVDYFLAFPPPNNKTADQIKKADLVDLIDWASDSTVGLISPTTKNIATVVRNYRNLIHPGVEYRKQVQIDRNVAVVAKNLVEMVCNEIRRNYTEKLGYTAEQAITKINLDVSSTSLFDHMIVSMADIEKVKLFKMIPFLDFTFENGDINERLREAFRLLYNKLKLNVPQEVRKNEALKLYKYINEKSRGDAVSFLHFVSGDIDLLDDDKRNVIVEYIVNILETDNRFYINQLYKSDVFVAIAKYFNNLQGSATLYRVTKSRAFTKKDNEAFMKALSSIVNELEISVYNNFISRVTNHYNEKMQEIGKFVTDNVAPF